MSKTDNAEQTPKPENNKPVAQKVVEDTTDTAPKATGQKANMQAMKGKATVNLKNKETDFIHYNLPTTTAEILIKKKPNAFEIV